MAALKERLSCATGLPATALFVGNSDGELGDGTDLNDSVATSNQLEEPALELIAWMRRYSLHCSETAAEHARARGQASVKTARSTGMTLASGAYTFFSAVPKRAWVYLFLWLTTGKVFKYIGFGAPCGPQLSASRIHDELACLSHRHALLYRHSHMPDLREPWAPGSWGSLSVYRV